MTATNLFSPRDVVSRTTRNFSWRFTCNLSNELRTNLNRDNEAVAANCLVRRSAVLAKKDRFLGLFAMLALDRLAAHGSTIRVVEFFFRLPMPLPLIPIPLILLPTSRPQPRTLSMQ